MDARKDDDLGRCRCRLPGEPERVSDVVGHVLDLGPLIIVRQHDGVAGLGQPADFRLERLDLFGRLAGGLDDG
jgi:hypothetical protein